MLQTISNDNE